MGLTDITIEYSRPGVKDRTIFGGLLAYGEIWRTGANAATTISFSDDVKLEGNSVPAGKYALYTIPGKEEWTIMIYKDVSLGGNVDEYDEASELVRIKVTPQKLPMKIETLTFNVGDIRDDKAIISLMWEETKVSLKIEVEYDSKVMTQIESQMENPLASVGGEYSTAATYYLDQGKDLNKALEWINEAIKINPDAFWRIHTKAQIQAAMKEYKGAIKTAEESMAKAKANEGGDFGYIARNEKAIAEWKTLQ